MTNALRRLTATSVTALFGGSIVVILGATLWLGRTYYVLPRHERPLHELHGLMAPGGSLGVGLGLLGTGLMVAMLLYTVRKALPRWKWLGAPSGWLRFHVICGIGGPAAIVLHGGLYWPEGLVAVAFWCMVAVALSGVFGRYVYALLPRAASGRALALVDAQAALSRLRGELVASTAGADPAALTDAIAAVSDFERPVRGIWDLLVLQAELRRRRRLVDVCLSEAGLPKASWLAARTALGEQLQLKRALEGRRVAGRLMRYWHLFHRPLAGAMYVIVLLHVASAVLLGGSLQQLAMLWE